jgi:hypothetical protein
MTISVMLTGSLFREPAQRTSKAGRPFVAATVKVAADNEVQFWTALAFGETAQVDLMRLIKDEKLAVQGALKIEAKIQEDAVKIYRTVFVDAVLSLRPAPRERKPKPDRAPRAAPPNSVVGPAPSRWSEGSDLDDPLPF